MRFSRVVCYVPPNGAFGELLTALQVAEACRRQGLSFELLTSESLRGPACEVGLPVHSAVTHSDRYTAEGTLAYFVGLVHALPSRSSKRTLAEFTQATSTLQCLRVATDEAVVSLDPTVSDECRSKACSPFERILIPKELFVIPGARRGEAVSVRVPYASTLHPQPKDRRPAGRWGLILSSWVLAEAACNLRLGESLAELVGRVLRQALEICAPETLCVSSSVAAAFVRPLAERLGFIGTVRVVLPSVENLQSCQKVLSFNMFSTRTLQLALSGADVVVVVSIRNGRSPTEGGRTLRRLTRFERALQVGVHSRPLVPYLGLGHPAADDQQWHDWAAAMTRRYASATGALIVDVDDEEALASAFAERRRRPTITAGYGPDILGAALGGS